MLQWLLPSIQWPTLAFQIPRKFATLQSLDKADTIRLHMECSRESLNAFGLANLLKCEFEMLKHFRGRGKAGATVRKRTIVLPVRIDDSKLPAG